LVLVLSQYRNPGNITGATFDGSAATLDRSNPFTTGAYKTVISYWNDGDLPAAAGTYNITIQPASGGYAFTVFELSGWSEVVPTFLSNYLLGGEWSNPEALTISGSNAGAAILQAYVHVFASLDFSSDAEQVVEVDDGRLFIASKIDSLGAGEFSVGGNTSGNLLYDAVVFSSGTTGTTGPDYTARKGSTETITHTLTADGITTATLNGETVTIGTQSGQDADINFTDTITTSGEYDLVLGDGVDTETFTVQYNVIGLTTNTIQKDGASIGAQSDVEMHVLDATGATVLGNLTGLTTDAAGITGQTIVPAGAVDDSVRVIGYSDAAEIGFAYKTTLGLL